MDAKNHGANWSSRFSFASGLSASAHSLITEAVEQISVPEGSMLLDEGGRCDPVLFVDRGILRVYKRVGDDREITLYRVSSGEVCVLAVTSALSAMPYSATAVAAEPIQGYVIPAGTLRRVFAGEPAMQDYVMRLVADRLTVMMTAVVEVGFERMDRRLARFLVDASGPTADGTVKLSHEQVARELGTAREVVTRVLDSFAARGLVSLGRRRIRLLKLSELDRLAQGRGAEGVSSR